MAKRQTYDRKKTLKEETYVLDVVVDENSLSAKETRKLFKRGNVALAANNFPLAAKNFFKAWEADPDNLNLLTVVSHILSKLGHQAIAIEFLEKAIAKHGVTEDICKVMGEMALALELYEVAEKVFSQAVQFNPQEEKYYIQIASALEGQNNAEGAIQFMEEVVKILDKSSDCWCMLGTLCKGQKRWGESAGAFNKALKYNPDNLVVLNNYAGLMGVQLKAKELAERAIKIAPQMPEPHMLLSTYLLYHGELKDGWKHYEYRNDPSRGVAQTAQHTHGIKTWAGQPLEGKAVFLAAEQGIGDEIYYAQAFHKLMEQGATLVIGCDKRLQGIYERSYPGSRAFGYDDKIINGIRYRSYPELEALTEKGGIHIDYSLNIASIPLSFWQKTSDIQQFPEGYLRADSVNVEKWKEKFKALGAKPKIGVSWRSGYVDKARKGTYAGLESLLVLIKQVDADFVCLQYDYTQDELDEIKSKTGKSLFISPDIDLKNDIENNLAIMANLDFVIGPNIATQMLAMASGAKTCLLSGRPWWAWETAEGNTIHHAPKSSYRAPDRGPNGVAIWENAMTEIIQEIKENLSQTPCKDD